MDCIDRGMRRTLAGSARDATMNVASKLDIGSDDITSGATRGELSAARMVADTIACGPAGRSPLDAAEDQRRVDAAEGEIVRHQVFDVEAARRALHVVELGAAL